MCYLTVSRREPMLRDRKCTSQWSTAQTEAQTTATTSTSATGTTTSGLISSRAPPCAESRTNARRCVSAGHVGSRGRLSTPRVRLDVCLRVAMPR
jgi:hypothetical protein